MTVSRCIFVSRPKECSSCLQSQKPKCLLNHRHLKVSKAGRRELLKLVGQECDNPRRYKERAGQEGR